MQIIFGPDAPSLEEQGLDVFMDCEELQERLDELYTSVDAGLISPGKANDVLSNIASSIEHEVSAMLAKFKEPYILPNVFSNMEH